MNKFIVWYSSDVNENKFSEEFTLEQLIKQDHLDYISDSKMLKNYKVDSINSGVGLKDINGKSIYADSSIVEIAINYKKSGNRVSTGYFKFNKEYLRYEVVFIDGYMKGKNEFYNGFMHRFKIIDTIQENKLGLIK